MISKIFFQIVYYSIISGDESLEDTECHKNTLPNLKSSYNNVYSDSSDDDNINKITAKSHSQVPNVFPEASTFLKPKPIVQNRQQQQQISTISSQASSSSKFYQ